MKEIFRIKYIFFLLILTLISSCGTTQHFVPIKPIKTGDYELRFSFGMSTCNFSTPSFQLGSYFGISENNAVGFTFNNFLWPSSFSYIRYLNSRYDNNYGNLQFHLNNVFMNDWNPTVELDGALGYERDGVGQSIKLGIALYSTPLIQLLAGRVVGKPALGAVVGYQLQVNSIMLETDILPGQSKYFASYVRNDNYLKYDSSGIVIAHDDVKEIIIYGDDDHNLTPGWTIVKNDGSQINIYYREPYVDCVICGFEMRARSAYKLSDDYQIVWIDLHFMELNMKQIIENYHKGGDLVLKEDKDLVKKVNEKIDSWLEDISISIGNRDRKN